MLKMSIKQLFFTLVAFVTTISVIYISINYIYMKEAFEKTLHTESINRAYHVTKRFSEMNDKVAKEYDSYEQTMYEALEKAQVYFGKNGSDASLEELKKALESETVGTTYHVYIINNDFIVKNTTYSPDMGLDFHIIPDVLKEVKETYLNPNHIDLSTIMTDSVSNDYKRYILQRAYGGEYLIQLSLTLENSKEVKKFTEEISELIPSLINSNIFIIYPSDRIYENVHLIWSSEYTKMKKSDRLINRNVQSQFMSKFDPEQKLNDSNFKEKIYEFVKNDQYKDIYFYRDDLYIHQVMMPFYSYLNADDGTVHILSMEFDGTESQTKIQQMKAISILVWIVVFIFGMIIIVLVSKRIILPLSIFQLKMKAKETMDKSSLSNKNDEIGSMISIYNQLLIDLNREIITNEELLEVFKNFTGDTIHQIRTPISVIKVCLEMIESENTDALLQIKSSLVSIEHMYDSLTYTLQENNVDFPLQKINFSELVNERVKIFSTVALAHDTQINTQIEPDIYVNMNKIEAEYLIDNNISNAIKYGKVTMPIDISLYVTLNDVLFSIKSAGEPIDDTNAIFERYFRADKSRKGTGIGLHMVKSIAKKYNIIIDINYIEEHNIFNYYLVRL